MCNIRLIPVQSMSLIIAINRSACTLCLNRIYAVIVFLIFNIIKFKFHFTIICIVIFLKPCCCMRCIGIDRLYVCIISRDCRISSIWAITSWTPKTIELIALFPLLLILIIFQIITHIILIHHSPWNLCTN